MESTPPLPEPDTLFAVFEIVPDPRRLASTVYPLQAVLAVVVAGLLAGLRSLLAIAEWIALQPEAVRTGFGLPAARTPVQSTLHRILARLDPGGVARVLATGAASAHPTTDHARGSQGVAIDGKCHRGRGRLPDATPIHQVSLVDHDHDRALVLAAVPVTSGPDKTEAELTVAPGLLTQLAWTGRVLTGDALYCQRTLCRQIIEAGGDYVLRVKDNQPSLRADLALLFDPPTVLGRPLPGDRRAVTTTESGHGRRHDTRTLVASTDLTDYLAWPGLAQVIRLERTWIEAGVRHRQVHYGITSLPPEVAGPARLLTLWRGHWTIENRVHRHKDVTFGEDAATVRRRQGPVVMALLRDCALNVLARAGITRLAAWIRAVAGRLAPLLALIGGPNLAHA